MKHNIKKLYFLTREGEFLKDLYERIKGSGFYKDSLPDAELLEASRMSTFFPSLRTISICELMRIWNPYPRQSMEALFQSLHLKIEEFETFFDHYRISREEILTHPWEDPRVRALFQDKDFLSRMRRERDRKRKTLYEYFLQKGWVQGKKEKIGLVDIGWRGTIQDNLCYLFPDHEIIGFYAGLQPFLSSQPPNGRKYGYINGCRWDKVILFTVTPLEMLCNSPNGSTLAYENEDGHAYAVRKNEKREDAVYDRYAKQRQQKIKSALPVYCRMAQTEKRRADRKKSACRALYRFIAWPDRKSVDAYFSLTHNDEFGTGNYVDKNTRFQIRLLVSAFFYEKKRREFIQLLRTTAWPQGYLVKYRLYPLLWIYNRLLPYYLRAKDGGK